MGGMSSAPDGRLNVGSVTGRPVEIQYNTARHDQYDCYDPGSVQLLPEYHGGNNGCGNDSARAPCSISHAQVDLKQRF